METMQTLLDRKTKENNKKLESLAVQEMEKISQDLKQSLMNSLNTKLNSLEKDTKQNLERIANNTEKATMISIWKLVLIILIPILIINIILYFWIISPRMLPSEWERATNKKTIIIPRQMTEIHATETEVFITPKE
ncbi:hypothetical protein HPU229254_05585 (plasmid) [Helicobacter pullorum]|nr:hypothetical protein HPU229254_05585 [Helicobacter pullorum]